MIKTENNLLTDVKVVNEAVFSSTKGTKKFSLFGIPIFTRIYNESIGEVKFLDKDDKVSEGIGFNKKEKK